jgi:hypothetical protein
MAEALLRVPGVYVRETFERPAPVLATGVPAFIGLVTDDAPVPEGAPLIGTSYGPVVLHRKSDFPGGAKAYLQDAIDGFFDNGGEHCYVIGVRGELDANGDIRDAGHAAATLAGMLPLLAPLNDVDLIAVPDAMALIPADKTVDAIDVRTVQSAMILHATEQADRVVLLDALPGKLAQELIDDQLTPLGVASAGPVNVAIYHPWIRTVAADPGSTRFVPPCGHIAGVIARTDAAVGVFKAPANAEIQGATDLQVDLDLEADALGLLNDAGINCLRAFPSRGIRVWGARTPSTDPAWRYLNVRRLALTLLRWVDLNMAWVTFEPNVPALWARIQRELDAYLTGLWRAGALAGSSVDEAFFVRCDAELNSPDTRDLGQVVTEIGIAPAAPAEFIVVSIQHRAGTTELI